jgi:integrase
MLTQSKIQAMKPRTQRYAVADGHGLTLEVQPSGVRSWRLRYRFAGRQRRVNLGRWPMVSLAAAREQTRMLRSQLAVGLPLSSRFFSSSRKDASPTFKEFVERYLGEIVSKARRAPAAVERWIDRDLTPALGALPMRSITAEHVRAIVFARRDSGRPQAARALRNLIKRIFDYAQVCGVVDANPAHAVPLKFVAKPHTRDRALSEAEIGLFLRRLTVAPIRSQHKAALRLILLTMVRKSELRLAQWEHVHLDRAEWEIPKESSKTGAAQIVYLSRQAVDLLRGLGPATGFVLPHRASQTQPMAPSTLNRALAVVARGMIPFTVHDLRRTAATRLSEMEFNKDWIEKAMNHTLPGVRGIYNRAQYAKQRRRMLQTWADAMDRMATAGKL